MAVRWEAAPSSTGAGMVDQSGVSTLLFAKVPPARNGKITFRTLPNPQAFRLQYNYFILIDLREIIEIHERQFHFQT
jgi:hypothetical protein